MIKINKNAVASTVVGGVIVALVVALLNRHTNLLDGKPVSSESEKNDNDVGFWWWL